jgi:GntR family histidine utilization transcriptional repressor
MGMTEQTPQGKPSFRAVKAAIREGIENGTWGPGAVLPGEVEIAARFGVARATVSRAMGELAGEGIVERRRRAGTRVRAAPLREARFRIPVARDEIEATGATYRYRLLSRAVCPAPAALAARLGLADGAQALHLRCLHAAGMRPWQVEDRWISLEALPAAEAADFATVAPTEWLVATVPYSEVEVSFTAAPCPPEDGALLDMGAGAPVFVVERATWWQGRAITQVRLTHAAGYRMTTRY